MVEANTRTFADNWTGTGLIGGAGDAETICLDVGEYMESELVDMGAADVELLQNNYDPSGDNVLLRWRTGATPAACLAAAWTNYVGIFTSLGIVQVRLESTL